jgi:diguanylate cyclase (GGDEF)-like protein
MESYCLTQQNAANKHRWLRWIYPLAIFVCLLTCVEVWAKEGQLTDTLWIDQKLEKVTELTIQDPKLAINFIEKLIQAKPEQLTELNAAKLKIHLIENYLLMGKLEKSNSLITDIDKQFDNLDNISQVYYLMMKSTYLAYLGKTEEAEILLIRAEKQAKTMNNSELLADVYLNKGGFYNHIKNDAKAIDAYSDSYELMNAQNDKLKIAYIENAMVHSYESLYDFRKAINLQLHALSYFDEHDLHFDRLLSHYNLARLYLKENQPELAIGHAEKILVISGKVADKSLMYFSYILSAKAFHKMNNVTKARYFLDLAEPFSTALEGADKITNYLFTKANIEIMEGKFVLASETLKQAKELFDQLSNEENIKYSLTLYQLLATLCAEQNEFKKAYQYQAEYIKLINTYHDSVRESVRSRHKVMFDIKQIEHKNILLEKDKTLNAFALIKVEQEKELQRVLITSILLIFVAVLIFTLRQYRLKQRFSHLANTDALTNVCSRRKVMEVAENTWKNQSNEMVCIIAFDLDHFKKINDVYGHPAGDLILQKVSKAAGLAIRKNDLLGRIGGEEFLIVLEHTAIIKAQEIAQRIKNDIENLDVIYNEQAIKVTASFGIVQKNSNQKSFEDFLMQVDSALYKAKERGRNRIEIYE